MNHLDILDRTVVTTGPIGVYRRAAYLEWLWFVSDGGYIAATGTAFNETDARRAIEQELGKLEEKKCTGTARS